MPPLQGKTKTYSNLVLVGPKSVNNRVYAPEVLRKAVEDGLYNGVPIFLDHEEKIQTLVGRVTKAYWDEDKNCIRGDIEIYDSPYSSIIDIIINVFGGEFGFSHVVEAEVDEDKESGKEYVKHISKVKSVDLVTDPATTRGINEVQERVMNAIRNVIKESRKKQLKECGENATQKHVNNTQQGGGVIDNLIQAYYNGEISLPALVKLLEILSQGELRESVERKECCQESEGKTMPKRKLKEQESDFMKDEKLDNKDKEVVDHEDTKEQEEDKEKEDKTLEEGEDLVNWEDGEEDQDKEVEEEEDEVSDEDEESSDDEELEEQDEEDAEDNGGEDVEEDMEEEVEEDHEEDEGEHEDKELKESKKRSKSKVKQVKESVISLKRELNLARKKLRESQKLLEEIVKSRYVPSPKEYKIISESKDPVGLIKILSEKRVVVNKSKPKTISESRNNTQKPDEWDQMIEEVRRRKGLIR